MKRDVLIVGAGPAGLAMALSLARLSLRVTLIEQQAQASLAEPADDGREIALHRASLGMLDDFGALRELAADEIAAISSARVSNGQASRFLDFQPQDSRQPIGHLISNHLIRRGLYRRACEYEQIELLCEQRLRGFTINEQGVQLSTERGEYAARLLIAADSRHSSTRQALGIAAHLHDFGKTMLVCRVEHEADHQGIAWEWFDLGRTLATLPLSGRRSSLAITLPQREAAQLAQLPEPECEQRLTQWLGPRLGALRLISARWSYPLVATYAQRFWAPRAALIGDAAVGMHPVTAHGFNFGLSSQQRLSGLIAEAMAQGRDIASERLLRAYDRGHRRHTLPLFLATNGIVDLYTRSEPAARLARRLGIELSSRLPPLKQAVLRQLRRGG